MQLFNFSENGLKLTFGTNDAGRFGLLNLSDKDYVESADYEKFFDRFAAVEVQQTGVGDDNHNGGKHFVHLIAEGPVYDSHTDERNEFGRLLCFNLKGRDLAVKQYYQFYDNTRVIRSWVEVTNIGNDNVGLDYVSSFCLTGMGGAGKANVLDRTELYHANSSTWEELNWRKATLRECGLSGIKTATTKRIKFSNTGTWSCKEYMPYACLYDTETDETVMWQIESNCSWHFEISTTLGRLCIRLSGPTEAENGWWKSLKPNEKFESLKVAIAITNGGFDAGIRELNEYRRVSTPKRFIDKSLPVIFNDYMVCLNANPTVEKELPLIDKAAELGAEIYCMDAGWYSTGDWWPLVGEWKVCEERFTGGMKQIFDRIHEKGMRAGIWLEPEVMGINCPLVPEFEDCFFKRHGKNIIDNGRYQLDFRKKKVREHLDSVVDRLIKEYDIDYFKFDYNIDPGVGTETDADSFGDGLLQCSNAYLDWVDSLYERYPNLMIENCSSGGMRMDGRSLQHFTLQSISDAWLYHEFSYMSVLGPTAVIPEQAGMWVCPRTDQTLNENAYCAINGMLHRFYFSGHSGWLDEENTAQLKKAIEIYKEIRHDIPDSKHYLPLGICGFESSWQVAARVSGDGKSLYVTAGRVVGGEDEIVIPLDKIDGKKQNARVIFPEKVGEISLDGDNLTVKLEEKSAILIKVDIV